MPAQHLAQDQDRPLTGRKCLQGSNECQPNRLGEYGPLGRIAIRRCDVGICHRLDPHHLGKGISRRSGGRDRHRQIHRQCPAFPAAKGIEAHVGRDPVEPRPDGRPALEAVERLPGLDQRLLHGVVGVESRPEHAVAVAPELAAVLLELLDRQLGGDRAGHCATDGAGRSPAGRGIGTLGGVGDPPIRVTNRYLNRS